MRRRNLVLSLVCLGAAAVVLGTAGVASAGGGGHGACDGFTRGQTLAMRDSCFQGAAHFADAGTITGRNEDQMPHDIVAVDGSFSSPRLAPGETFEIALDDAGVVPFFCSIHGTTSGARMAGVLVVGDPALTREARLASASAGVPTPTGGTDRGDVTAFAVVAAVALLVASAALGVTALSAERLRRSGVSRP